MCCVERVEHVFVIVNINFNDDSERGRVEHEVVCQRRCPAKLLVTTRSPQTPHLVLTGNLNSTFDSFTSIIVFSQLWLSMISCPDPQFVVIGGPMIVHKYSCHVIRSMNVIGHQSVFITFIL